MASEQFVESIAREYILYIKFLPLGCIPFACGVWCNTASSFPSPHCVLQEATQDVCGRSFPTVKQSENQLHVSVNSQIKALATDALDIEISFQSVILPNACVRLQNPLKLRYIAI